MKRWVAGTLAGGVLAVGLAVGAGVAFADPGPGGPGGHGGGPGGLGGFGGGRGAAFDPDRVCEQLPRAVARLDGLIARLDDDATVRGSTAWLQQRVDQTRAAGHAATADLMEQRLQQRPAQLQELRTQLAAAQTADCG
jgi:hypothetical protein